MQAVAPSLTRAVASVAVPDAVLTSHEPAVQAAPPLGGPDGPLQVLLAQQLQGEQYVMDTLCSEKGLLCT